MHAVAVLDPDVVDAIGTDLGTGEVVLTIIDHLRWDDDHHLGALRDKLNRHLAFIESGELIDAYPDAKGRSVRIEIVCQHRPVGRGLEFLENARVTIQQAGFSLTWRDS